MTIKNVSKISDSETEKLRQAIEHRATWFYLLLDEARKRGLDWEDFARKAIFRCGCFHGETRFSKTSDLRQFSKEFANETVRKIFEMRIVEASEDRFVVEFNYCPLVAAWQKFTQDEQEIATLCDIAMEGDRGIISTFPGFTMELQDTIASGGKVCRLIISKEKPQCEG
jgi:hypothetical protein